VSESFLYGRAEVRVKCKDAFEKVNGFVGGRFIKLLEFEFAGLLGEGT
jgi:hypothetical protein